MNKKAIEALIKCGAFGSTGATRRGMLAVLESAQAAGQKAQLDAQIGQGSISTSAASAAMPMPRRSRGPRTRRIPIEEFERGELLAREKESIGMFITEHPLKRVREALRVRADTGLHRRGRSGATASG